jgi:hypothetical protein
MARRDRGCCHGQGQRSAHFFGGRADGSRFLPALNFGTCGCLGLRTSGSAGSWICFVSLPRGRLLIVHSLVESVADADGQLNQTPAAPR